MAIPHKALDSEFLNLAQAGNCWRIINFTCTVAEARDSVKKTRYGCSPDASIWLCPTDGGSVDKVIGTGTDSFKYPYNMAAYKLLWAMFYAQLNNYAREKPTFVQREFLS